MAITIYNLMTYQLPMDFFESEFKSYVDSIIKQELKKAKNKEILILGFSSRGVESYAKKRQGIKKIGKFFYKGKFDPSNFFDFAKNQVGKFDVIFDVGFSAHLYKSKLSLFYTYNSRILKFGGKFYSFVLSSDSEVCKSRCPIRQWSHFGKHYIRFVSERTLKSTIQANFRIESLQKKFFDENVFFQVMAFNDMEKF